MILKDMIIDFSLFALSVVYLADQVLLEFILEKEVLQFFKVGAGFEV